MATTSSQATGAGTLRDRYAQVKSRISQAAKRSGRRGEDIALIAVSKYAEPDQIRDLIQLGHTDFGENQVQQLLQRAAIIDEWLLRHRAMPSTPWAAALSKLGGVRWHMIGHLQRNKARKVAEVCRMIHSVDSLRLAEELQQIAARMQQDAERRNLPPRPDGAPAGTIDVLLQVNVAGEKTKFGCSVPAALHLAEQIDTMIQLRLRGIMTMAPYSTNPEDSRRTFSVCRELFIEMRDAGLGTAGGKVGTGHFNVLSMGMSGDYEVAIEEGANMVRVGTGIFGEPRAGMVSEGEADDAGE